MAGDVESFRDGLDAEILDTVDAIRAIIAASHSGLTERIKWHASSFSIGADDRITLGLERKGGVRVVVHRSAKLKTLGRASVLTTGLRQTAGARPRRSRISGQGRS
jgi:hypothetical protein